MVFETLIDTEEPSIIEALLACEPPKKLCRMRGNKI